MATSFYQDKTLSTSKAFRLLKEYKEKHKDATVNMSFEVTVFFTNAKPLERFISEAGTKNGIALVTLQKTNRLLFRKYKINICGISTVVYSVITDIVSMYPNSECDD